MATTEVVMAGFGGQGMLLAGKVLAEASLRLGKEVSWLPSYGPEMRGGTANVIVRISSEPIGSPLVENPRGLMVMNLPSLEKFAPKVQAGGVIVVNSSLVDRDPERKDCVVLRIDSRELAKKAGTHKAANFVMLGAYVGATDVVPPEAIETAIRREFEGDKKKFISTNTAAFRAGLDQARQTPEGSPS